MIKLVGQTFDLFIFLLPFCPIEGSCSAPLHFLQLSPGLKGPLIFPGLYIDLRFSLHHLACLWLLLFQPEDCSSPVQALMALVLTSLSTFAESLHGESHLGEMKPSSETADHNGLNTIGNIILTPSRFLLLAGLVTWTPTDCQTRSCQSWGKYPTLLFLSKWSFVLRLEISIVLRYFCLALHPSFDGYLWVLLLLVFVAISFMLLCK